MLKITGKKRFTIFITAVIVLVAAIIFVIFKAIKNHKSVPDIETMSINEASKKGEKKTVQLLVQIAQSQGDGRPERGDVILSAPEDRQFSVAEQEGFLIIKVNITETQEQLLHLSLREQAGIFANEEERMSTKTLKRRKFSVDLEKIGVGNDETKGRIIEDKVFEDDVLIEKK